MVYKYQQDQYMTPIAFAVLSSDGRSPHNGPGRGNYGIHNGSRVHIFKEIPSFVVDLRGTGAACTADATDGNQAGL